MKRKFEITCGFLKWPRSTFLYYWPTMDFYAKSEHLGNTKDDNDFFIPSDIARGLINQGHLVEVYEPFKIIGESETIEQTGYAILFNRKIDKGRLIKEDITKSKNF